MLVEQLDAELGRPIARRRIDIPTSDLGPFAAQRTSQRETDRSETLDDHAATS